MTPAYIAGGTAALLVLIVVGSYNRFVHQRQLIDNSWSNVDTELKRRYDLIPNLVETVKGYAAHEREALAVVIAARSQAMASRGTPESQAGDENLLACAPQPAGGVRGVSGPEGQRALPRAPTGAGDD